MKIDMIDKDMFYMDNGDFEISFKEKNSNKSMFRVSSDSPVDVFRKFQRTFDQKFPERTSPKKRVKKLDDSFSKIMGEKSDFNL